jgi:uncharacterized protein involved in oxidation of intracellular sulfur
LRNIMMGTIAPIYNGALSSGVSMSQQILIIASGAPYGSESLFNALRLGLALQEEGASLRLFLLSDAVSAAIATQAPAEGYHLRQMLDILLVQGAEVRLCQSCCDARGIGALPLIEGIRIDHLPTLAQWTLAADKVLTF